MRVPHTVPHNTLIAYEPSESTLGLVGERSRRLRAENYTWDENYPPSLVEESVRFFVQEFDEHKRALPLMEQENDILLLETLSTSLSLHIVIPLIPDGVYWKRRCNDTWSTLNDVTRYGDSWKRMFTERFIEDLIESEEPGFTDWPELGESLKLCAPFIQRLVISQLKPPREQEAPIMPPDPCNTEDFIPDHLDLCPVLAMLNNLEELDLQFGVKNIGMKFTFKSFKINIKDVEKLGKGLVQAKNLKILRISCSDIDDTKLQIILRSLEKLEVFQELEIAHCKITDHGANSLGHFITVKRSLKHLKLQNNRITTEGAQGLAFALTVEGRAYLETLDLKFNLIGEEGGQYLATALAKSTYPGQLTLAGCGLGELAGKDLANMLKVNKTLTTLDLTNNALGTEVGALMVAAAETNKTILKLDVRNCGFEEQSEIAIHHLTFRNRERVRKRAEIRGDQFPKLVRKVTAFIHDYDPPDELKGY